MQRPDNYRTPTIYYLYGILLALFVLLTQGVHRIDEGNMGLYWRGGRLLQRTSGPGFNLKFPLIDHYEQVQVTIQTDHVSQIPCGTSGGVVITFGRVEVVNRLRASLLSVGKKGGEAI